MSQQELLDPEEPPRLQVFLDEPVLRLAVGGLLVEGLRRSAYLSSHMRGMRVTRCR